MRKLIFIFATLLVLGAYSCRTNEANYRAAYEKAREKQTETGDSLTTAMLRNSDLPRMTRVGNDSVPLRTFAIGSKIDAGSDDGVARYCVVVGRFRQIFNASQMCKRLADDGYPQACVVHDRQNYYYVIAGSTSVPTEVLPLLNRISGDKSLVLNAPYPYILRPAHLAR